MLNSEDGTNVPDKTIAIFLDDVDEASSFTIDRIPNIIKKPPIRWVFFLAKSYKLSFVSFENQVTNSQDD